MSRFKRLPKALKELHTDQKYDQMDEAAKKRAQRRLMLEIKRRLEMKGTLNKKMQSFVYHAARFVDDHHLENQLGELITLCYEVMPRIHTCPWQARAMHFFYFLRDHKIDEVDLAVRDGYMQLVQQYKPGVKLPAKDFLGYGTFLLSRLRDWVGQDAGNTDTDLLVDYLQLVLGKLGRSNSKWLLRPSLILGDLGWTIFMEEIEDVYGGLHNYKKPSSQQVQQADRMDEVIQQLTLIKAQCIESGDLSTYDELEKDITNITDIYEMENRVQATMEQLNMPIRRTSHGH